MIENGFNEEPFNLRNDDGETFYGIVHKPQAPNGGLVVMFNIGLHYRVSHSRLFVRQARRLQRDGFIVARLDTSKIGYSHGEMPIGRAIDTYDAVQTGLFKDDAVIAVRYLIDRFKPRKTFLTGLCGGALTAIITASLLEDISGVVFIAGPVTVTSADIELSTMHPVAADIALKGYFRRMFSLSSWANFLTGKTTYSRLFRALKTKAKDMLRSRRQAVDIAATGEAPLNETKGERFNPVFYRAFDDLMKNGKEILFVMPELDRATYDFDRIFGKSVLKKYDAFKKFYSVYRLRKADHTFSRPAASKRLFDITSEWLLTRMNG